MLANWLIVAFRALARDRVVAGLNIAGLALGLLAATLILAFVRSEVGYDSQWPEADRIVRVGFDFPTPGREARRSQTSSALLVPAMREELPAVELAARFRPARVTLRQGELSLMEPVAFAEPELLRLFPPRVLAGDPEAALARPDGLVLTEGAARRLFGDADPLGRGLLLDGATPARVEAVVADWPAASHLDLGILAGWESAANPARRPAERDAWFHIGTQSYALLRQGESAAGLSASLADLLERRIPAGQRPDGAPPVADFAVARPDPVRAIHLSDTGPAGLAVKPPGSLGTVQAFAGVALLVLALAGLNFANLTAAQAARRRGEAAVRKVLGATRGRLLAQFLLEAALASLAALVLALALAELVRPWYEAALGRPLLGGALRSPLMLAGLVGLALAVGLL
ncbi:MAG TPA: ABC transporter permease, partial [Azospirillaceae bacterium]|nr:ABC transporter permease [Azospirillaceae bacterium]